MALRLPRRDGFFSGSIRGKRLPVIIIKVYLSILEVR